jgi:hypothetical protein
MSIVVDPGYNRHACNLREHLELHGNDYHRKRTGGMFASELFEKFKEWTPLNYVHYTGANFETILKGIKSYVDNGTHSHC